MKFQSLICVAALVAACGKVEDVQMENTDTCNNGDARCNGHVIETCKSDTWIDSTDCAAQQATCQVTDWQASCVLVVDTDINTDTNTGEEIDTGSHPDTDTDSNTPADIDTSLDTDPDLCDGDTVDCYTECWGCAMENACADLAATCASNFECTELETCIMETCAANNLTGDEWISCKENCESTFAGGVAPLADYYNCVYCDACPVACVGMSTCE